MSKPKNPRVTTPLGKLQRVFGGLHNRGIVARGRWTCCQSCGGAAIWDIYEQAPPGSKPLGFVFFHDQDWDHYRESGVLWLAYGSFTGPDEHIAIIVSDALDVFEIPHEWSGKRSDRIRVTLGKPTQRAWRSVSAPSTKRRKRT